MTRQSNRRQIVTIDMVTAKDMANSRFHGDWPSTEVFSSIHMGTHKEAVAFLDMMLAKLRNDHPNCGYAGHVREAEE